MKTLLSFSLFIACHMAAAQDHLAPVGQWREHLPYNSAIDLATVAGKVYCATPYSLFSVEPGDNSIERYSRVTGLSETGISSIAADEAGLKLLVAYQNSNLDIFYRNDIINIPDIKRDNSSGDKTVYHIYPRGNAFYLSTGLGVIVVDADRYEIKDTWLIGNGGNPVKVNAVTSDGSFFYAATEEGLKKAASNAPNLADHHYWQAINGTAGCKNIISLEGRIIMEKNDSLFIQNGVAWTLFYGDGWPNVNSHLSGNKILLAERQSNGISRVLILGTDGSVSRTMEQTGAVSFPRKALLLNSEPWVADQYAGLSRFSNGNAYTNYSPNSPQAIAGGEITVDNHIFYGAAGSVNDAWNYQYNGDGIFVFTEGHWNNINRYQYPEMDSLLDFISLAVDKRDETAWAGSFGGGLLHIGKGPSFEIFKQGYLGNTEGDPSSYRVAGLAFDRDNNLWISNFGAAEPLRVRKADGNWVRFSLPFALFEKAVSQILVDDNNYKWIVSPLGNGLICFDHGTAIENTGDDRWKMVGTGNGNGNLPSNDILCIAKDKSGFIWVGSSDGIGVIQCPDQAFAATGCDAVWPVVPQGNFAGYLFKGEEVRSIAVDGADRKWVATKNGVFLVNAGGEKVIAQFNEANSPLLSNDVRKIAVDGKTGEVYFATLKGICSFRGTATEGGEINENVLVFPNPVPPGFAGTIAIRGLVNNALVKITELDGRLVYQTRALGGQAVWDGKNYRGQKIVSGAYLVLVSEEGGKEKTATKIFFIAN
ncbi:MAG: hypothetical protein HYZ15_05870 [Sphingobacteriales bacterium]|nr:hypothetical protein [Sphingobacteriales bacterium]